MNVVETGYYSTDGKRSLNMKCQLILTFIVGNFEGHCLKSVSSISVTSISRKMVN